MGNQLISRVDASVLAKRLGLSLIGEDVAISCVTPLSEPRDGGLSFSKKPLEAPLGTSSVVIASSGGYSGCGAILVSPQPRLDFAKALLALSDEPGFVGFDTAPQIHPTARIGANVVIGRGVTIGAHTIIHNNVVIGDGVRIGERCRIKSNTVIGEDGFGFERDDEGLPIRMVHLGSVVIGDDVEIGSLNTVCRGTLVDTVIGAHVKTDDHVHIAHNCSIGRGVLLTACVELSGGVDIGDFAWVGPNSSVINQATIGDGAFVGIGANVTKSVAAGVVVAGNPAKQLRPAI